MEAPAQAQIQTELIPFAQPFLQPPPPKPGPIIAESGQGNSTERDLRQEVIDSGDESAPVALRENDEFSRQRLFDGDLGDASRNEGAWVLGPSRQPLSLRDFQPGDSSQSGAELPNSLPTGILSSYRPHPGATLRALDKITARSEFLALDLDSTALFGTLAVTLKACFSPPASAPPDSIAFLEVDDYVGEGERIFSGWMFASNPALSALEHAIYDLAVVSCGS